MKAYKRGTQEYVEQIQMSKRHINEYTKNNKLTREKLSEITQIDTQALGRYCRGEVLIKTKNAEKFHEATGIIPEYWFGLTECKSKKDYLEEIIRLQQEALDENAALYEHSEWEAARREQIEKTKSLINAFGFGYENLGDGYHDFLSLSTNPADQADAAMGDMGRIHKITEHTENGQRESTYLTNEDMTEMMAAITEYIRFTCYKKRQQYQHQDK